jgi:hypothetical protein
MVRGSGGQGCELGCGWDRRLQFSFLLVASFFLFPISTFFSPGPVLLFFSFSSFLSHLISFDSVLGSSLIAAALLGSVPAKIEGDEAVGLGSEHGLMNGIGEVIGEKRGMVAGFM